MNRKWLIINGCWSCNLDIEEAIEMILFSVIMILKSSYEVMIYVQKNFLHNCINPITWIKLNKIQDSYLVSTS